MTAPYLKCDGCGAEFEVLPRRKRVELHDLQEAARAAGWTGPMNTMREDALCPACTAKAARNLSDA